MLTIMPSDANPGALYNGLPLQIPAGSPPKVDRRSLGAVELSPSNALSHRVEISDGLTADVVQARSGEPYEFRFRGSLHLLVVYEQGARQEGDTFLQGLSRSTLRDISRRLTFVPAGHEYCERHEPCTLTRIMYVYFDPARLQSDMGGMQFAPRLFFEDSTVMDTALKLKTSLASHAMSKDYVGALAIVLLHELVRLNCKMPVSKPQLKGGLAAWQQRVVATHIDAHLSEPILLTTLAQLTRLSSYYFCRAFKRSFGVPPHRYHTQRRIERAKALLADRTHSVTEIGLAVGYSETSSFSAAFRKITGLTPSGYQRSLD